MKWGPPQVALAVIVACVSGAVFAVLLGEDPYVVALLSSGVTVLFITYDEGRAQR